MSAVSEARSSPAGVRAASAPAQWEPSLGELKARHREEHLCLKCQHHLVCGMAKTLDPNLLVTISSCLGFDPAAEDDSVCELTPIEPLATTP